MDFLESPTDPLGGEGVDLGLSKRANAYARGGTKSDVRIRPSDDQLTAVASVEPLLPPWPCENYK